MIPGMEGERHDTMDDEDDASPQDEQIRNVDFIDINEEAEEDNVDL